MNASPANERKLRDLLASYDPLGIDSFTDEYLVIVRVILGRLEDVATIGDLENLIDESFGMWVDEDTPELTRDYARVTTDFWEFAQN